MALAANQTWTIDGDRLRCRVDVHPTWRQTADAYVLHRLRQLRALPQGFHHPIDARLLDDELVLSLEPGAVSGSHPVARSGGRWHDDVVLPLISALLACHGQRVAGFGPNGVVCGRWLPPAGWFLPPTPDHDLTTACRADREFALAWLKREASHGDNTRDPRDRSGVDAVRSALADADPQRLSRLIGEERIAAAKRADENPGTPAFISLLTEGELMERVACLYRYRRLRPHEAEAIGMDPRGHWVLEVDRSWADPHFPAMTRPSPQEIWDALVDESKVTPVLAVSQDLPNPLSGKLAKSTAVRWIGVHADQPFIYVPPDGEDIPPKGYVRLHLAGDNVLMDRKRKFTAFAGTHPALASFLTAPPPFNKFTVNPQRREDLEDAVLATRGVFAVQGPPGTGKTHLATEVVRRFLAREPTGRVLVCAKEHFALDHILAKITAALVKDGVPLRAWRSVSLAKRRRGRGEVDAKWQSPTVVRDLSGRGWTPDAVGWSEWEARASSQHDQRLASLGEQSANLYFATTMDSSMVDALGAQSFDLVIVEEAGKCYPSELLHALCLGRTALMIGDQRQLPPYQERRTREGVDAWSKTLSRAATDPAHREQMVSRFGPLFLSLEALASSRGPLTDDEKAWLRPFEFLFDRVPTRHRLEEQFRMEAPLSRVVGKVFYDRPFDHRKNELVERGLLSPRPLANVLPPELDVPLVWLDTPHMTTNPDATEDPQKRGVRDNRFEVDVVLSYLRRLRPSEPIDMVILTPYNAQKRLLLDSPDLRAVCQRLTKTPFEQVVRTTDEYQGREAELTILSLVRNNSLGARAWGFMTEPERLNVMFSRTRFRQVVVGCSAHIVRHAAECEWLHKVWEAYKLEGTDPACARILPAGGVANG